MRAWTACTLLAALPALAGPVTFTDTGVWQLRAPGLPHAEGSLFLWHGSWQYAVPRDVAVNDGGVSGSIPGSAAGAQVHLTARAYPLNDGMTVTYTFRRDAGTELTRGIFSLLQLPLEPLAKRAIRFASSSPQLAGTMFQGAGRSFSVNLSDTQALRVQLDRTTTFERRRDQAGALAINVLLLPAGFPADTDVPVTVTLRLEPAGSEKMPWQTDSHEPLAIRGARLAVPMVPVNGTATVEVDLTGTFDNPFDPEQIALDAEITAPDESLLRVPGYFQQEYLASRESGMELLSPRGEPYWRVRFTPTLAGRYRALLKARDKTGEVRFGPVEAQATAADLPGMVRIGRFKNCFVREAGKSIFLIGHNVPTYLTGAQGMAECFDEMAAGGENYTRLWMYSAHLGLEWGQPVGTYRLDEAWRLDHAFELARQRGQVILLCMDTHQDFLGSSLPANPYNQASGGPIKEPLDYFSNPEARRFYQRRLRYIVARWSHCTNLVAWEFVNEIEGWSGYTKDEQSKQLVADWHRDMAAYLRGIDPYRHPITTSCWTTEGHPSLWNTPGIDIVQSHHYANARVDMAGRTAEICARERATYPGRVHLFGEMGINSHFSKGTGDDEDPTGGHLHEQSWAALMSGSASVPVNWWHESYFEPHNLYGVFRGIRKFTDQLDLDQDWRPIDGLRVGWVSKPAPVHARDLEIVPSHSAWTPVPADTRFVVQPDGTVDNRTLLPQLLHGKGHSDLRIAFTFDLTMPADGQLIAHVERCSNNPHLLVDLDGRRVLDKPYPTAEGLGKESVYREQWKLWETRYDEDVTIPVPAGKHTLTLSNDGGDWMAITSFRLPGYLTDAERPFATALGMSNGREAVVWVRNELRWWLPVARGETIPTLAAMRVRVPGLKAGRYALEQWNTVTGAIEARREVTLAADEAGFDVPPLAADVAFRLRPVGG